VPEAGHEISLSTRHERGEEEFSRVLAFSDGLFAIAMTLLVVGITVPTISDTESVGDLASGLEDEHTAFVSFFISFAVIGRYWLAHHQFFSRLAACDGGLVALNLLYLAFIAFLPFPTDMLGNYFQNPLSVVLYAMTTAVISGMEVVLFRHAHRHGLLRQSMPEKVFRWGAFQSLAPVLFFLLSVPVAFISTGAAVAFWFLSMPFGRLTDRWKPAEVDRYSG
jgi:TMEM175 potassium channel family protein